MNFHDYKPYEGAVKEVHVSNFIDASTHIELRKGDKRTLPRHFAITDWFEVCQSFYLGVVVYK